MVVVGLVVLVLMAVVLTSVLLLVVVMAVLVVVMSAGHFRFRPGKSFPISVVPSPQD